MNKLKKKVEDLEKQNGDLTKTMKSQEEKIKTN